jgi:hypothetical protein
MNQGIKWNFVESRSGKMATIARVGGFIFMDPPHHQDFHRQICLDEIVEGNWITLEDMPTPLPMWAWALLGAVTAGFRIAGCDLERFRTAFGIEAFHECHARRVIMGE